MFTGHRLSPANKLDCRHAMGTHAFSGQRAESFRHFLLFSAVVQKEQTSAAESRVPFRLPYGTSGTRALPDLSAQAGVAPDTRRGVPAMLSAGGEFPEAAQEALAV